MDSGAVVPEIWIRLTGVSSGDSLRDLRDWLSQDSELRGRIVLRERPPVRGPVSPGFVEALTVGLGSGGAITVMVSGIVSWVRHLGAQRRQTFPAEIRLEFADGSSVHIVTETAAGWTQAELAEQVNTLAGLVAQHLPAEDH